MKQEEGDKTFRKICSRCGKGIANGNRGGSLTAYLFSAFECNCSSGTRDAKEGKQKQFGTKTDEVEFCPKCGLQKIAQSKDGSLTAWMFQSTRCKCFSKQALAHGEMIAKFSKLRKEQDDSSPAASSHKGNRPYAGSVDLNPGVIIGGVYKVMAPLGSGGMGEVYLVRHETLAKKCALKVIPPEQVTDIGWQRFQLEAKAVAKLDHVNLVRVTDLGIHDGCLPFYAMDYVDGQNLAELLLAQGPMPMSTMLEIFMQVCDGVEHAHRSGILHRDLKPGNIMLTNTPGGIKQVKVLDFGLAKLTGHDREKQSLTAAGDVFGSPFYMSPEQCRGEKLDNRSDIYSIGCTMFECLTGRPPFNAKLAKNIILDQMESDPPSLDDVVRPGTFPFAMEIVMAKLLRKNPAERYQTLSQLRSDLERVYRGEDVLPVYVSRDKTSQIDQKYSNGIALSTASNRFYAPVSMVVILVVILSGAAGYLFFRTGKPEKIGLANGHYVEEGTSEEKSSRLAVRLGAGLLNDTTAAKSRSSSGKEALPGWDGKPFCRGLVTRGGTKYYKWVVPISVDDALTISCSGTITLGGAESSVTSNEIVRAFLTPLDAEVNVKVYPTLIEQKDFVNGLADGTFNALSFVGCSLSDVGQLVPLFVKFKSIGAINVGDSSWTVSDGGAIVSMIDQLPSFIRVAFSCPVQANALLKLRRLHELQSFGLSGFQPDMPACLKVLATCKKLVGLSIEDRFCSKTELAQLENFSNLTSLRIGKLFGTHEQLGALAKMRRVQQLVLPDLRYRPDLATDLKQLKPLQQLTLRRGESLTDAEINRLRLELPRLQIMVE